MTDPLLDLFNSARAALEGGFVPSSGVLVLVTGDHAESRIESTPTNDPLIEWYHLTVHLIALGHHPSDLMWGVVLAYLDKGPEDDDASTRAE